MTRHLKITVNGTAYDVVVEQLDTLGDQGEPADPRGLSPVRLAPPPAAAPAKGQSHSGSGEVASPLSGKIVAVDVVFGQWVSEGQIVATIEAMKMNTQVTASRSGTVKEVCASVGDAVEEGQTLMVIG